MITKTQAMCSGQSFKRLGIIRQIYCATISPHIRVFPEFKLLSVKLVNRETVEPFMHF